MSRAATLRMASSRWSWNASRCASSSPEGSSSLAGGSGSSKRGLQVGEPRRHHEIVGGKFEADALRPRRRIPNTGRRARGSRSCADRLFASAQERGEDRAALRSRRSRRSAIRHPRRGRWGPSTVNVSMPFEKDVLVRLRNHRRRCGFVHDKSSFRRRSATAISTRRGWMRSHFSAAAARASDLPSSSGTCAATAFISAMSPLQWRTMSPTGSQRAARAIAEIAAQRLHAQIVGHQQAIESNFLTDDLADHLGRQGRRCGIDSGEDHMSGHRERHVRKGFERHEIGARQLGARRRHARQFIVRISACASVSGNVLDDRKGSPSSSRVSATARPSRASTCGSSENARSPMMLCDPGTGTSRHGIASTVTPISRRGPWRSIRR